MKTIALVLSILLILASGTAVFLKGPFRENLDLQRKFSRFFLLSDETVQNTALEIMENNTPQSSDQAVVLLREAVSKDPLNPHRWCFLGEALTNAKRVAEAEKCYTQAIKLGPNDNLVLWLVFDFYMQIKRSREALVYASRLLENDPSTGSMVFPNYLSREFAFSDTLNFGLPADKTVAQAYFRFCLVDGNSSDLEQCWNWIRRHSFIDDKITGEYLSFLIQSGAPGKAWDLWSSLKNRVDEANRVYNAGFETEFLPLPFDWKISAVKGAEAARDPRVKHQGSCSLRLQFDGKENLQYRHVSQVLYLDVGTYRLSAFIRAQGITTEQGIALRIGSMTTEQITGSTDWRELSQTIEVTKPSLFRLEVFRAPSRRIANGLSGTVWLDDVRVSRVAALLRHGDAANPG